MQMITYNFKINLTKVICKKKNELKWFYASTYSPTFFSSQIFKPNPYIIALLCHGSVLFSLMLPIFF